MSDYTDLPSRHGTLEQAHRRADSVGIQNNLLPKIWRISDVL